MVRLAYEGVVAAGMGLATCGGGQLGSSGRWLRPGRLRERLECQIAGTKALDVLELLVELVEVGLFVGDKGFEICLVAESAALAASMANWL